MADELTRTGGGRAAAPAAGSDPLLRAGRRPGAGPAAHGLAGHGAGGGPRSDPYTGEEAAALASFLNLDNIYYVLRAPVYARRVPGQDGRLFYGEGLIHSADDLSLLQLPDPYDDALYAGAERFLAHRGDYSTWFVTRMGIFPTMLGLGAERFSLALYEVARPRRDHPRPLRRVGDRRGTARL